MRGLLLHGMGGVGKSTLATLLANQIESAGAFPGGVYMVSVQTETQYLADINTLLCAQQRLLSAITKQKESMPATLDVGAQHMEYELQRLMADHGAVPRPVLLIIDNVPEGGSGIGELLPANLEDCLAGG